MKGLFSRRNAWMLAAVLVILGVGCAFGLNRGQKTMLAKRPRCGKMLNGTAC